MAQITEERKNQIWNEILANPGYSRNRNRLKNKQENITLQKEQEVPIEYKKAIWEAKKKMLSQMIDTNKKKQELYNKEKRSKEEIQDYLHNTKEGKELVQGIKDIMSNRRNYQNNKKQKKLKTTKKMNSLKAI